MGGRRRQRMGMGGRRRQRMGRWVGGEGRGRGDGWEEKTEDGEMGGRRRQRMGRWVGGEGSRDFKRVEYGSKTWKEGEEEEGEQKEGERKHRGRAKWRRERNKGK